MPDISSPVRFFAGDAKISSRTPVALLLADMPRLNIARAVIRHEDCLSTAPYFHNRLLLEAVAGHPELYPAVFITPDGEEPERGIGEYLDRMVQAGVRICWTAPRLDPYGLTNFFDSWCCAEMFETLQCRRIPLAVSAEQVSLPEIHRVMNDFPQLRIILLDLSRLGRQPAVEALLARHEELYLCFGPLFSVHGGYRSLVERYGRQRWIWGGNFPDSEGGSAVAGLLYSGLDPEARQAVASGNLERLLAEVRP